MKTKAFFSSVEVKNADQGTVQAIFSTLNVKDSDGDVTLPGAFEDGAQVPISAYGHGSWKGAEPIGKGIIRADDTAAILDGQFFLDNDNARNAFATIKGLGGLQQWSFGYEVLDSEHGQKDGEPVQFLKKLKVFEVSPVLSAAGVGTRTLSAKAAQDMLANEGVPGIVLDLGDGLETNTKSFLDEAEHALGSVQALITRAQALGSLRAGTKEGRTLSAANRARLSSLHTAMTDAMAEVETLLAESDPMKHRNDLIRAHARFLHLSARV